MLYLKNIIIFTALNQVNMSNSRDNNYVSAKTMPHNGKLLADFIQNNKINRAELARQLNKANTSVYQYAESPSLQMHVLWKVSLALNHNFVAELGASLPVDYVTPKEQELQDQIEVLQEQIEGLKKENEHQQIEIGVYKSIVGK